MPLVAASEMSDALGGCHSKIACVKVLNFQNPELLKLAVCPLNIHNFNFNGQLSLDRLYISRKTYYNLPNSAF